MQITTNGARVVNGILVTGDPALAILANDVVFFNQTGGELRSTGTTTIQISGARNRVVNEEGGVIKALDNAHAAIIGSSFDDTVENAGMISGRVDLGDGADQFIVNSGMLSGQFKLGDGADRFVLNGGSATGIVDLGAGDDTFVCSSRDYFGAVVSGGAGIDTLICKAELFVPMTTDIERLEVRFGAGFTSFQTDLRGDYSDIVFTGTGEYCFANIFQSPLHDVTISIDRVVLELGTGTVIQNVIGSDNSETLEFASAPAYPDPAGTLTGYADLKGGDDIVNFYSFDGRVSATAAPVSGGAGQDTINFTSTNDAVLDLASFTDFERLTIGGNFQSSATHTVLHMPDVTTIRIFGGGPDDQSHMIIGATDRPAASVLASGNALLSIAADATIGKILDAAAEPGTPFIETVQRVEVFGRIASDLDLRGQGDTVLNEGRIDGSVLLGDGADRYVDALIAASVGGRVDGGAGDDRFDILAVRTGVAASFDGGAGADLVSFFGGSDRLTLDLTAGTAAANGTTISVSNFEKAVGTAQNDTILGTLGANTLSGAGGDDSMDGQDGDDLLFGDAGNDTIRGGAGNDVLGGDIGNDILVGGTGDDRLDPGSGRNIVDGGAGQDTLVLAGASSAYGVTKIGSTLILLSDGEAHRVSGVETVTFADRSVSAAELAAAAQSFDALGYIASYADLRAAFGTNAVAAAQHYLDAGFVEGRTASFNALNYIASYSDLIQAFGTNQAAATEHYIRFGAAEGRTASFDGLNYIASNIDLVDVCGMDATAGAEHYIRFGAAEGRTVGFDALNYIASYSDLIDTYGANADAGAEHYLRVGAAEGRTASFDALNYIASYADLIGTYGTDADAGAEHYIRFGAAEGRTASFDPVGYLLSYSDLKNAGLGAQGALEHWINYGLSEHRTGDTLFGHDQLNHAAGQGATADVLQTGADRDWFAVQLEAGDQTHLSVDTSNFAGHLEIHDSAGHLLAQNDGTIGTHAALDFTADTGGTYYLAVASNAGAGAYMMSFEPI